MKTALTTVVLALVGTGAFADDAAVLRCRAIAESGARLACYDAIAVTPGSSRSPATAPVGTPVAPTAAATSSAPTFTPPPVPPVSPAPPAPATTASSQFGMEQQAAKSQIDAIESRIEGLFEGWNAKSSVTLANGQVWQIVDGSRGVLDLTNPKVTVRRGFMGAFYMEFEGSNLTPRVRRVR